MSKAKFSASGISKLLAEGSGATRNSYLLELAEKSIGTHVGFTSKETEHGINNQLHAFDVCVKPDFPDAIWLDKYTPINENCGASPDFVIPDLFAGDVKCPYYIDTFIEQCEKLPKGYFLQSQMQMMALGLEHGLMVIYLTKPEIWGSGEFVEYPFELEDRVHFHHIEKCDRTQDSILLAVEQYQPKLDELVEILNGADVVDELDFFYMQKKGIKYRKLKKSSNYWNSEVIRVGDEFYYKLR